MEPAPSSETTKYKQFVDSIGRSKETQHKYIQEFGYYLKYLNLQDPDTLITEDLLDSPSKIRIVEDQIIQHLKYLRNKKLSYGTINVRLAAILRFYTINRVNINRKYISNFKPVNKRLRKDRAYTHEQILALINSASDFRERIIILLLCATGMRVGALSNLTVSSLSKVILEGYPSHLYKIIVYEGEREEYYSFCTFECATAIDQYLDYRKRFGEVLKPSSPLIREEFDRNDRFKINDPKKLSSKTFRSLMDRMLVAAGVRTIEHGNTKRLCDIMSCHGIRKFTITQMKKAKLDFSDREFLVGHKQSRGLDVNYDRTTEEDRLAEYLKAVDLLTVSPENRLRKQVEENEHIISHKLQEKDQQIARLSKQIEVIQSDQAAVRKLLTNPEVFKKLLKSS